MSVDLSNIQDFSSLNAFVEQCSATGGKNKEIVVLSKEEGIAEESQASATYSLHQITQKACEILQNTPQLKTGDEYQQMNQAIKALKKLSDDAREKTRAKISHNLGKFFGWMGFTISHRVQDSMEILERRSLELMQPLRNHITQRIHLIKDTLDGKITRMEDHPLPPTEDENIPKNERRLPPKWYSEEMLKTLDSMIRDYQIAIKKGEISEIELSSHSEKIHLQLNSMKEKNQFAAQQIYDRQNDLLNELTQLQKNIDLINNKIGAKKQEMQKIEQFLISTRSKLEKLKPKKNPLSNPEKIRHKLEQKILKKQQKLFEKSDPDKHPKLQKKIDDMKTQIRHIERYQQLQREITLEEPQKISLEQKIEQIFKEKAPLRENLDQMTSSQEFKEKECEKAQKALLDCKEKIQQNKDHLQQRQEQFANVSKNMNILKTELAQLQEHLDFLNKEEVD